MINEVYVLNQKIKDGTICTSVFSNFDKCIDSVEMEFKEHGKDFTVEIEQQLRDQMYCFDGSTEYFIECCEVN